MQYMKSLEPPTADTRKSTQQCICTLTSVALHYPIVRFTPLLGCSGVFSAVCACGYMNCVLKSEWLLCSLTGTRLAVLCGESGVRQATVWRQVHQWTNNPVSFKHAHTYIPSLSIYCSPIVVISLSIICTAKVNCLHTTIPLIAFASDCSRSDACTNIGTYVSLA